MGQSITVPRAQCTVPSARLRRAKAASRDCTGAAAPVDRRALAGRRAFSGVFRSGRAANDRRRGAGGKQNRTGAAAPVDRRALAGLQPAGRLPLGMRQVGCPRKQLPAPRRRCGARFPLAGKQVSSPGWFSATPTRPRALPPPRPSASYLPCHLPYLARRRRPLRSTLLMPRIRCGPDRFSSWLRVLRAFVVGPKGISSLSAQAWAPKAAPRSTAYIANLVNLSQAERILGASKSEGRR